ncbi:ATP-binding protein [Methylobacterium brachiatum]|uniref:ATP-binding protein n=1 Tax=Methylobacterium brachiatum TaxID=269660 RepID=UPI0008E25268|nr:ATP-binding protein [Methylobacterium brachiatum]SFI85448.1 Histidine kinase-, DNA gyrase B-, and HSP90-like ATPase [Methylobacterium brachiatum]
MSEQHYRVRVEGDHIRKLSSAKPIQAAAELIWNAVDADATRVDVEIDTDDLATKAINIRDNGHGIPRSEVEYLFAKIGGSWKSHGNRSKLKRRMLHGKEGKGRYKALALGRVAEWTVRYLDAGKLLQYKITIIRDKLEDVAATEAVEVDRQLGTGVEVRITELDRTFRSLDPANAIQSLSEVFALYLTDYSDVRIFFDNGELDPSQIILGRETYSLPPIIDDGSTYPVEVEIIEWKSSSERWVFLCGPEGFPFHRVAPRFHTPGFQFTAYLKSPFIGVLQQQGLLDLAEMSAPLQAAYEAASDKIKEFSRAKEIDAAKSEIDQWKAESIYPYAAEPVTSVEKAERKVFDIVALNVNKHLTEFSDQSRRTKAFQLRMLKQAIERGPDELQHILTEVLELPERTQKELAKLLDEASLANVIGASALVSDRLKFVHGLEAVLFDAESRNLLKERSQLHRMIADNNTWIFGEEFNLTVDDQSLTEVLKKHRKLIGQDTAIDQPVRRIDGKVGIVDLMLSRAVPQNHADEREHLVVELKRPSVKIGAEEITQVQKYAFTVADDERFRHLKTRWSFWVISNDLDAYARAQTRQHGKARGQIFLSEDGSISVWVKSWAEVLSECKSRLKFVQDHLQANVDRDSSLKYLKKTYEKYLSGVIESDGEEPDAANEA